MANEENLVPLNKRTQRERKEIAQKGARASNEARRKRKALKESMNALLELPISSVREYNKLARLGIPPEELNNSQLIVVALFNQAKSGDVQAIKELRDLIGEGKKQEVTDTEEKVAEKLNEIFGGLGEEDAE